MADTLTLEWRTIEKFNPETTCVCSDTMAISSLSKQMWLNWVDMMNCRLKEFVPAAYRRRVMWYVKIKPPTPGIQDKCVLGWFYEPRLRI